MTSTINSNHKLFAQRGAGSAMAECFLTLGAIPFTREEVGEVELDQGSERLRKHNPLNEVPTLVLPSGQALTESVAIAFYVNDLAPQAKLIVAADHPRRAENLRWLVYVASNVYPTFTYGDNPSRWVPGGDKSSHPLRTSTEAYRQTLWKHMDAAAHTSKGPWFLGPDFGAIDILSA